MKGFFNFCAGTTKLPFLARLEQPLHESNSLFAVLSSLFLLLLFLNDTHVNAEHEINVILESLRSFLQRFVIQVRVQVANERKYLFLVVIFDVMHMGTL